jgi:hypothetical protein
MERKRKPQCRTSATRLDGRQRTPKGVSAEPTKWRRQISTEQLGSGGAQHEMPTGMGRVRGGDGSQSGRAQGGGGWVASRRRRSDRWQTSDQLLGAGAIHGQRHDGHQRATEAGATIGGSRASWRGSSGDGSGAMGHSGERHTGVVGPMLAKWR